MSSPSECSLDGEMKDLSVCKEGEKQSKKNSRSKKKREARKKKKKIDEGSPEAQTLSLPYEIIPLAPDQREKIWKEQREVALSQKVIPPVAYELQQKRPHKFWDTQPVPRFGDGFSEEGPVENKTIQDISPTPYPIADTLIWSSINVKDNGQLSEVYDLLRDNYVEDEDAMFRFNYSREFLAWALMPPQFETEWHVGVRKRSDNTLIAFIAGIPANIRVGASIMKICEINFLCVHKGARDKRMAPLLIKEVTRRINLKGIFQAVYTAGIMLPKPFARCRYWHRSLNPLKLIDVGFSRIPQGFDRFRDARAMTERHYKLPNTPQTEGIRKMNAGDVQSVRLMLNSYLNRYAIAPEFTEEEAKHWLLPRENVLESFVVEKNGTITDFFSFYALPSTIIGHAKYNNLKAAYCYYYFASSVSNETLLTDALILAMKNGYDVFNALDMLENENLLTQLKFGMGDGHLHYYLFNWRFPEIPSNLVGLVML